MKALALQTVFKVERCTLKERSALRVNNHSHAKGIRNTIALSELGVKVHVVRKARTTARLHRDPQTKLFGVGFVFDKCEYFRCGRLGDKEYGGFDLCHGYNVSLTEQSCWSPASSWIDSAAMPPAPFPTSPQPEARQEQPIDSLLDALRGIRDPELGANIIELQMITDIEIAEGVASFTLNVTSETCPMRQRLHDEAVAVAQALPGIQEARVNVRTLEEADRHALLDRARRLSQQDVSLATIPATTRIIGIASGKGGVGKSTLTKELAWSLAETGARVGVIDADISGYSLPALFGTNAALQVENSKIVPQVVARGDKTVSLVSLGLFKGSHDDQAVMWRGPLLSRALQHFLEDVNWGNLTHLLIDLPPGTSDVHLKLAQLAKRTELIVVTTPDPRAAAVAGRAIDHARKANLHVLGIVENQSYFRCDHGSRYHLFGEGGGKQLTDMYGVPLLAQLPFEPASPGVGIEQLRSAILAAQVAGCSAMTVDRLGALLSPAAAN